VYRSALYVADSGNNVIRAINLTVGPGFDDDNWLGSLFGATVTALAGGGATGTTSGRTDATGSNALFNAPNAVAVDPLTGATVFVADRSNNKVRAIVVATGAVTTLAGGGATGTANGNADGVGTNALFNALGGVAADTSGRVFVADYNNARVRRIIVATGAVTTAAGAGGGVVNGVGSEARFLNPMSVAIAPYSSTVFVADYGAHNVRAVSLPSPPSSRTSQQQPLRRTRSKAYGPHTRRPRLGLQQRRNSSPPRRRSTLLSLSSPPRTRRSARSGLR
jgi:hypothetical protein